VAAAISSGVSWHGAVVWRSPGDMTARTYESSGSARKSNLICCSSYISCLFAHDVYIGGNHGVSGVSGALKAASWKKKGAAKRGNHSARGAIARQKSSISYAAPLRRASARRRLIKSGGVASAYQRRRIAQHNINHIMPYGSGGSMAYGVA